MRKRGVTLVELVVVVAVLAIIATLAAPSLRDLIVQQRLSGIQAQLVTDLQLARSEAVARQNWARLVFRSDAEMTCYTLFTTAGNVNNVRRDCRLGPGLACGTQAATEIRTVQLPRRQAVTVEMTAGQGISGFAFDHVAGTIASIPTDRASRPLARAMIDVGARAGAGADALADPQRSLRVVVNQSGRPSVCRPSGSLLAAPPCP